MDTLTVLDTLTGISAQDAECGDASGLGEWYALFDLSAPEDLTLTLATLEAMDPSGDPVILPAGIYIYIVTNTGQRSYAYYGPDDPAGREAWIGLELDCATEDELSDMGIDPDA